jgi:hypothetical protein
MRNAGLIEYLLVFGAVLALAVWELVSVVRSQRRDQRILKGNSARTQDERNRSSDNVS